MRQITKEAVNKVYKQYLKARYFFKEDCQAVLKEYRPMRNIGMMIKKFFNPKCQQYWIYTFLNVFLFILFNCI